MTKSNAMRYGYPLWDRVVREVGEQYPQVQLETVLVDAMAARMIQSPRSLDVLLTSNLFGDILSDLAAVLAGGMGMAPSANVLPGAEYRVSTSRSTARRPTSPGRAWRTRWPACSPARCCSTTSDHTGAARRVRDAVAGTLRDARYHTADLGGSATTAEVAAAVLHAMESQG